jgi:fructan beta-fructosidase
MSFRWLHGALAVFVLFVTAPASADDVVLADFEGKTYGDWTVEGTAFGPAPAAGALPRQMHVSGYEGEQLVNSYYDADDSTGAITSPEFALTHDYLTFLIGGGDQEAELGVELLIDGERQRAATGKNSETLSWANWDVREFRGRKARIRIFDRATGGWGHILADQFTLADAPRQGDEVRRLETYRKSPLYYRELHRPQFHFTPEIHWMNDPNGLVYFDGEYHLFYQHNPHGIEWGHMSWGHAVSDDLVHWKHLPIAIHEEYGVMAFSGSAVVDEKNTSGFGQGDRPPLVAIYTGHGHGRQTQDLAYSNDRGRTWTKYEGNPVIDIGEADFRDPKVFWHEPTKKWVMVVTLAAQKKLRFYGSPNLKDWTLLSEFGPAGTVDKSNWECPDLFELPIENEPGKTAWLLEADMGGGAVAGGSGSEFFLGDFDGRKFTPLSTNSQWADFGRDFYAQISWSDIPATDGRRIWLGWMNNWETPLNPTYPWRSAMTVPRELTLRRIGDQLRLCQRPVRELEKLRTSTVEIKNRTLRDEAIPLDVAGQQLEIELTVRPGTAKEFGVKVLKHGDVETVVGYDTAAKSMYVDRTRSGNVTFHPAFAGKHSGPPTPDEDGLVRLHVLVDACSVEAFGNHGETVITDLVFPGPKANRAELFSTGGDCEVVGCTVHKLKSAWGEPGEK